MHNLQIIANFPQFSHFQNRDFASWEMLWGLDEIINMECLPCLGKLWLPLVIFNAFILKREKMEGCSGPYEIQKVKSQYYAKKLNKWIIQTSIYFKERDKKESIGKICFRIHCRESWWPKSLYLEVNWKFLLG